MAILSSLLAATLLTAAGETALLDFSAPWCAPCRSMEPVIARLEAEGIPVRRIDFSRDVALAQQFGVTSIPCFVMIVNGQEVDRVTGATSYARLRQMVAKEAASTPPIQSAPAASQSPGPGAQQPLHPTAPPHESIVGANGLVRDLLAATVRIRVADSDGASYGSGTIIDMHGEEALVMTCGHLFRDSAGQGELTVALFIDGQARSIPAQLVRYDLKRDLGLVSCRPGIPIKPIRVAPRERKVTPGDATWVTGCDRGGGPVSQKTNVVSLNRYVGPPNIQVAGQPPDGRSGGGLFTADGELVGVCNSADPAGQQGLYAALAAVHGELDQAGLSFVYHSNRAAPLESLAAPAVPSRADHELLGDAEIICIVRPKNKQQKSEVFVVEHASPGLIEKLAQEMGRTEGLNVTLPLIRSGPQSAPEVPQQVIRGQSPRR